MERKEKAERNSRINIRTMFVIHGEILFNRSRKGATRSIYHLRREGERGRLKRREPAKLMACVRDAGIKYDAPKAQVPGPHRGGFQLLKWNLAATAGVFHFVTYTTLETR